MKKKDCICRLADEIWELAEVSYREEKSAAATAGLLEEHGFSITAVPGMATAFTGSWGAEGPSIGILGEYDALPGLSQMPDVAEPTPEKEGAPGHGCGHHALGAAGVSAALAVREYMLSNKLPGRIVFFGCPAEEGGYGKVHLLRKGVFDGLDAALTWHPGDVNGVHSMGSLSNLHMKVRFSGVSAHAAGAPHMPGMRGRLWLGSKK